MNHLTPLRYPGGKRRLTAVVRWLIEKNGLEGAEYIEPFAGGAAVGLALLYEGKVSKIHLNDLSRPVYAFWHSVLHQTDQLCAGIERVPVTMGEWYKQRSIFDQHEQADLLDVGLATFFLNRTNRSGILSGGVIGGKNQAGHYLLDCRFNKTDLVQRIREIASHRDAISIYQMDAELFCRNILGAQHTDAFVFFDPPYITNGDDLYLNDYDLDGHKNLAKEIQRLQRHWICTYDLGAVEAGLFAGHRRVEYGLPYMAQGRRKGYEAMFMSNRLILPEVWRADCDVPVTPPGSTYELTGHFFP